MQDRRLTGWTEERVELLKKLWAAGATASEIALELGGVTRNAVCGKIDRLGLSGVKRSQREREKLASGVKLPRKRKRVAVGGTTASRAERIIEGKKRAETPTLIVVADTTEAKPQHIDFYSVTEDTCKWAYGYEPSEFTFCGAAPKPGKPYCAAHCRVAYEPPPKRRRSIEMDWKKGRGGVFGRGKAA